MAFLSYWMPGSLRLTPFTALRAVAGGNVQKQASVLLPHGETPHCHRYCAIDPAADERISKLPDTAAPAAFSVTGVLIKKP